MGIKYRINWLLALLGGEMKEGGDAYVPENCKVNTVVLEWCEICR